MASIQSKSYTIRLRSEAFLKAVRLAGYPSDYGLARAMGVNRSTVTRVMSGSLQPGPSFIGGALIALRPMEFNDLFEIVQIFAEDDISSMVVVTSAGCADRFGSW
ncbi:transcriptional regulator [Saccharothrix sp. BKS2]|uniref:transcriptional regulator n=1 Tax=Saccharothrix sp. BKS2 TaxID=3064400 RepID=UPI0039E8C1BB